MYRFYSIIHDLNNKFAERTAREILACESKEDFASALANRGTEMRIRKEIESYSLQEAVEHAVEDVREEAAV